MLCIAVERITASCSSTLCNLNINGSQRRHLPLSPSSLFLGLPSRASHFGGLRVSGSSFSMRFLSHLRSRRNFSVFAMAADGISLTSIAEETINSGRRKFQVSHLVKMKAIIWFGEELGAKFVYEDILTNLQKEYLSQLIETVVELDDDAKERYLEGVVEPDEDTIKKLIRKGTISGSFVLVLRGSVFKNKRVQLLLDAVVDYLPTPLDVPLMNGTDPENP
ncbi:hypothetical protein EZV62_024517 [Acer yangbiense]|uniref:Uncharacterized protein n=1 Tax=Acer yangbiense TaxID=1000413 RepID=A0A5C7GWD4_9ROSI|nr:hypothetical protein EZV62_024517 [Acer yangbiense]